ncbi:MAG: hypothetical protein ACRCX2_33415 [Paraclostridium sp.]
MIRNVNSKNKTKKCLSVYDYNAKTLQELLSQFYTNIEDCMKITEESRDFLKWLKDEGITDEVIKKIDELIKDGTIKDLINKEIFSDLNKKVDEVRTQIMNIPSMLVGKYCIDKTGVIDCTTNFKSMLENEDYIYLEKGIYKISDLTISNKTIIGEIGCKIIVDTDLPHQEFAIKVSGKNYFENIVFEMVDTSTRIDLVSLHSAKDTMFINCSFNCFKNTISSSKCPLDIYSNCQNIVFENCTINAMSDGSAGGVWIRNVSPALENITQNIVFNNCVFNKKGGDELIAVWGWRGYIDSVSFNKCIMNGYNSSFKNPSHFLTLGMGGTTNNIIVDGCKINIAYNSTISGNSIFKSYKDCVVGGSVDHGKIGDNCKIINTDINITNACTLPIKIFRCEKSVWTNYIVDNCNINSNCKIEQIALSIHRLSNCNINIVGVTNTLFYDVEEVRNNIINYESGKLLERSNLYNNNVNINNNGNIYILQFLNGWHCELINNKITLAKQCQAMFGNSDNINIELTLRNNIFINIGIYLVGSSMSKIIMCDNDFTNIEQKTINTSGIKIVSNNIVDNVLKITDL